MKRSSHFVRIAQRRNIFAIALIAAAFASACRRDMQVQPRYNPYDASSFFDDGRAFAAGSWHNRAPGQLHLDDLLETGKLDGKDSEVFPFAITHADLERGRQHYNIYCTPCHDYTGSGRGMIVLRGFPQPPSFHMDRLRQAAPGHFVDVITNGLGVMYPYNDRVTPEDRWRIAAYIRALQLSESATSADVPAAQRGQFARSSGTASRSGRSSAQMSGENYNFARFEGLRRKALIAGGVGIVVSALGSRRDPTIFFRSYLLAFIFWVAFPLGALAVLMLHSLTGGGWGFLIRRVLEACTRTMWLLAVLYIPLLLGMRYLYMWTRPGGAANPDVAPKAFYLNVPFFLVRSIIYFAVWLGLSALMNRWSLEQDRTGDQKYTAKLAGLAGPGIILYGFTISFAAVDWIMSLEPSWFSTIYGMVIIVAQVLVSLAFVVLVARKLADDSPISTIVTPVRFNDLGNLLLDIFVMLWAYLSFSQFLDHLVGQFA